MLDAYGQPLHYRAMATPEYREETGQLLKLFPGWLFLRTAAGRHWRLDVEEERIHWLIGLNVRVKGRKIKGSIKVESIVQA